MGVRVSFATKNDTTLDAFPPISIMSVNSCFNGFPFSIVNLDDHGDGTEHPIELTRLQLMELIWRCKKFSLTTDSIVYESGVSTFTPITADIENDARSTEVDVISTSNGGTGDVEEQMGGGLVYTEFQLFLDLEGAIGGGSGADYVTFPLDDDPLFPGLIIGVHTAENDDPTPDPTFDPEHDISTLDLFGSGSSIGNLILTTSLISKTIPLYSNDGTYTSCNITMNCIEYWEYATAFIYDSAGNIIGGGLPVWDSTTGAQLRDPLS